ncbi:hypothetical protein MLD38_003543 [Melastoma candidum]|uniref:Uncharacterized protein n=1 Tax=Melastoma candidum TaxID=119954 RepID=A0ACB9S316_9MYRT|nr:hypothetical protein MLD38_003543 [Melastoma candidum]
MSTANFGVSAGNFVLLSNFSTMSTVMKEFSLNVTSSTLRIMNSPSTNSIAFLNALEVVSSPDTLIQDGASILPSGKYQGILTLLRRSKLYTGATNFSNIGVVNYVSGGPTQDTAPSTVYGTCTEMNSASNPNSNFNVTWDFDVDVGFRHLVRFHFCDIVSKTLNQLYFNVYIDSSAVVTGLDLSTVSFNVLAAPYYVDLVTSTSKSSKMQVSIGPYTANAAYPNAILNGLEIMKLNNSVGSLSGNMGVSSSGSSGGNNTGMIVGVVVGVLGTIVLAWLLFLFCRRR